MIKVEGMHCNHCKKKVETALKDLGLKGVKIDLETGIITYKPNKKVNLELIKETISQLGYQV